MATIAIRVLSSEDWRVWRELRLAALADAPRAFGSTLESWQGTADSEQRWRARLQAVAFNIVAELGGRPVGMASGAFEARPGVREPRVEAGGSAREQNIELLSMWVAPGARGQGVGDRLALEVADWARAQGAQRLVLRAYASNERALTLYRRNGFRDTAVVKARSAGREDELELVLSL